MFFLKKKEQQLGTFKTCAFFAISCDARQHYRIHSHPMYSTCWSRWLPRISCLNIWLIAIICENRSTMALSVGKKFIYKSTWKHFRFLQTLFTIHNKYYIYTSMLIIHRCHTGRKKAGFKGAGYTVVVESQKRELYMCPSVCHQINR